MITTFRLVVRSKGYLNILIRQQDYQTAGIEIFGRTVSFVLFSLSLGKLDGLAEHVNRIGQSTLLIPPIASEQPSQHHRLSMRKSATY